MTSRIPKTHSSTREKFFDRVNHDKLISRRRRRVRATPLALEDDFRTLGAIQLIALLGPGDFLGEECIVSNQPIRLATTTAITDCSVMKIEKQVMIRTLYVKNNSGPRNQLLTIRTSL